MDITPVEPIDGATEVKKTSIIKFTVVDFGVGVDLSSVVVIVDGEQIYSSSRVADGWEVSVDAVAGGYSFIARPVKRFAYYTSNEDVRVTVHVLDLNSNPFVRAWTFGTIRNLRISTYNMILGGIRTKDED